MAATTPHNRRGGLNGVPTVRHPHRSPPPADDVDAAAAHASERKPHRRRPPAGPGGGGNNAASAFLGAAMIALLRYRRLLLRSGDGGGGRERARLCAACLLLAFLASRFRGGSAGLRGGVPSGGGVGAAYPRLFVSERSGFRISDPRRGVDRAADDDEEPPHGYEPHKKRKVHFTKEETKFQRSLENSKRYDNWKRDPLHEGDCVPMRWWQETSFPSCNKFHELIGDVADVAESETFASLARGGYNDVFKVRDVDRFPYVLKVLQGPYDTDFTDRNFDRVRRDSLIMERTTASPYVMDIYGFCGFAQLVTYSREGNLDNILWHRRWEKLDQETKLRLAAQVSMALTAVHDTDGDGISAMSHGDFAAKQYIKVGDVYKLNDFNRGRFIRWNEKKKEPCTYTIGNNDGVWRAPEEYKYEPETSKIDVWALGSIFFEIVTGRSVWEHQSEKEARRLLMKGELPPIPDSILNSDDPIDRVLLAAIDMCYVYDPAERPHAGEVSDFLVSEAKKLGVEVEAT